jgi:hypothetical protein
MGRLPKLVPSAEALQGQVPTHHLSKTARTEIAEMVQKASPGVEITDAAWRRLEAACNNYVISFTHRQQLPRLADVEKHLKDLQTHFAALSQLLHLDEETSSLATRHTLRSFERHFARLNSRQLYWADAPADMNCLNLCELMLVGARAAKDAEAEARELVRAEKGWPLVNFFGHL